MREENLPTHSFTYTHTHKGGVTGPCKNSGPTIIPGGAAPGGLGGMSVRAGQQHQHCADKISGKKTWLQ